MDKIKIKDIEGSQETIIAIFNENGLDLGDYIKCNKKINVPKHYIILNLIAYLIFLILLMCPTSNFINRIFLIFNCFLLFLGIAFSYAKWQNKYLIIIEIVAGLILLALALNIRTPDDIITFLEDTYKSTN